MSSCCAAKRVFCKLTRAVYPAESLKLGSVPFCTKYFTRSKSPFIAADQIPAQDAQHPTSLTHLSNQNKIVLLGLVYIFDSSAV